jgi:beta-galactosidase
VRLAAVFHAATYEVLASFEKGSAAFIASGNHHYLACWPDTELVASVMVFATRKAGVETMVIHDGFRIRRRGNLLFTLNFGSAPWTLSMAGEVVLGSRNLKPQQVTILREI